MEPIVFEDGFLNVDRGNQVLQEFLYYHPQNGQVPLKKLTTLKMRLKN